MKKEKKKSSTKQITPIIEGNTWIIEEICLKNFLSHINSRFIFNQGINVVFGPNGAGKSSLLEGLFFVINENKTRYPSWRDYIYKGATDSKVTVKFTDGTQNLFMSRSIRIDQRSLSGKLISEYNLDNKRINLKNLKGKLVEYQLDLANPLLIVRQTDITKLVGQLSSKEMRTSIESIIGLKELVEQYNKFDEKLKTTNIQVERLKAEIERSMGRINELKFMSKKLKEFRTLQDKKENVLNELLVWKSYDLRSDLELNQEEIEKNELSQDKLEKELIELEKDKKEAENDIKVIELEIQGKTIKLGKLEQEKTEFNKKMTAITTNILDFIELHKLSINRDQLDSRITRIKTKIENIQNQLAIEEFKNLEEVLSRYNDLQKNINENDSKLTRLTVNLETLDEDYQGINQTFTELKALAIEANLKLENEFNNSNFSLKHIDYILKLQISINATNQAFIKEEKLLVEELSKNENMHKAYKKSDPLQLAPSYIRKTIEFINKEKLNVLGPVAWELAFDNSIYENICKYALGFDDFYTFICFDEKTRKKLLTFGENNKINLSLYILDNKKASIPEKQLPELDGIYGRVIDLVSCKSEVHIFLYDRLHQLVAVKDIQTADQLAKKGISCITEKGTRNYKASHGRLNRRRSATKIDFLKTITPAKAEELKFEINELKISLENIQLEKSKYTRIHQKINQIKILADKYQKDSIDQDTWLEEKEELVKKHNQIKNEQIKIDELYKEAKLLQNLENIQSMYIQEKKIEQSLGQVIDDSKKFEVALVSLENDRNEIIQEKEDALQLMSIRTDKSDQLLTTKKGILKNIDEIKEKLKDFSLEINKRTPKLSQDELSRSLNKVERLIAKLGTLDFSAEEQLMEKMNLLETIKKNLTELRKNVQEFQNRQEIRHNEWLNEMNSLLPKLIKETNKLLIPIGARCDLELTEPDIKTGEIKFFVSVGGNLRLFSGYSGGEQSIIAMALILALQRQRNTGNLCILDEFDQSLDELNTEFLRNTLQTLSKDTQYIILTPAKSRGILEGNNHLISVYKTVEGSQIRVWKDANAISIPSAI